MPTAAALGPGHGRARPGYVQRLPFALAAVGLLLALALLLVLAG
jgi:lactate permease